MQNIQVILYTDGSSRGNPGPGGFGLILEWAGKNIFKEFSQGYRKTTNNRMELLAVITGLEMLKKSGVSVLIITDSKYVVDAVEKGWLFGWEKKNFKDKKNPDLWIRFLKIYRQHNVTFQWIKGHNNHKMNEHCDFLAVQAATSNNFLIDEYYETFESN